MLTIIAIAICLSLAGALVQWWVGPGIPR